MQASCKYSYHALHVAMSRVTLYNITCYTLPYHMLHFAIARVALCLIMCCTLPYHVLHFNVSRIALFHITCYVSVKYDILISGSGDQVNLVACPAGTFSNRTLLKSEEDCMACDRGMYCDTPGQTKPSGQCDPGFYCTTGVDSKTPDSTSTGIYAGIEKYPPT